MRKVTELGELEIIHCSTRQESDAIRKLMKKSSMQWCTREDYDKGTQYYENICYYPKDGTHCNLDYFKKDNGYTIYRALEFLPSQIYELWN